MSSLLFFLKNEAIADVGGTFLAAANGDCCCCCVVVVNDMGMSSRAADVGVGKADGIDGTPLDGVVIACADGVVGVSASVPAGRAGETVAEKPKELVQKISIIKSRREIYPNFVVVATEPDPIEPVSVPARIVYNRHRPFRWPS